MAKKEKQPAFLFYSKDWLAGTRFMSKEDKSDFIDLLAYQHNKGESLTTQEMKTIIGDRETTLWDKFVQDSDGRWYNEKLRRVILDSKKYSSDQSERALKGWEKRRKKSKSDAIASAEMHAELDPEIDAYLMPRVVNETVYDNTSTTYSSLEDTKSPKPQTLENHTQNSNHQVPNNTGSSGVTPPHIFRNQQGMIKEMFENIDDLFETPDQAK